MAETNDMIDSPARSALASDAADVRDMIEGVESWRRDLGGSAETEELRYVDFPLPCHLLRDLEANVGTVRLLIRKLAQIRVGFGDATGPLGDSSVLEQCHEIGMLRLLMLVSLA